MGEEYVIYQGGDGLLDCVPVDMWDNYVQAVPDAMQKEISRGHTMEEAYRLTMLANEK